MDCGRALSNILAQVCFEAFLTSVAHGRRVQVIDDCDAWGTVRHAHGRLPKMVNDPLLISYLMSAPSFSSFPDFDAEPDTREKKQDKKSDKKHREEKKHRDSDGRSSKKRHESRLHSRHRDSGEKKNESEQSSKTEDASKDYRLFFIDIRGDSGNVQYGSIHSGDIPRYRLINGKFSLLGLPSILIL